MKVLKTLCLLSLAVLPLAPTSGELLPRPVTGETQCLPTSGEDLCGRCGDNYCAAQCGETAKSCPRDCGTEA